MMVIMLLLWFFVVLIFLWWLCSAFLISLLRLGWKVTKPPSYVLSTCNISTMTLVVRYGCAGFFVSIQMFIKLPLLCQGRFTFTTELPFFTREVHFSGIECKKFDSTEQHSISQGLPQKWCSPAFSLLSKSHFFVRTQFSLLWKPHNFSGKGERAETCILPPRWLLQLTQVKFEAFGIWCNCRQNWK